MLSSAFLCPGQASQFVGMGKDLCQTFPEARQRFAQADDLLHEPLSRICFEGPEETLKQTKYTQPALFIHSAVVADLLAQHQIKPAWAAGHSLGEYSALYAAGAVDFESGLKVVQIRGLGMQRAGEINPGTMAAIIGLEEKQIQQVCRTASAVGIVQPANFNSPGQVVISGSIEGVRQAMELAKAAGAKLVKELVVSGAFHSPLMEPARESLFAALEGLEIRAPHCPIYPNVTAQPTTDPAQIRQSLKDQLLSSVLWAQSMQGMIAAGAQSFLEVGPGQVLVGLLKRLDSNASTYTTGTTEDLKKTIAAITAII